MNRLNKKQKNSKGSATILVILIVLTVVLFGVMNMMSVYTSYKISQKNLKWTKQYYEFDSKAQVFANNIAKVIDKYSYNSQINQADIFDELSKNMADDKEILLNGKILNLPIDKNQKIVQNNYIDVGVYFLGEDGKRAFYIDLKIPQVKGNKPYETSYWNRVSESFEYNTNPEFSEGEEIIIQ